MKRLLAALMVCCIVLTMLTGCVEVKKKDAEPAKDSPSTSKQDIDEALDTLEDSGVTLDPDLEDLLDDIDQADNDAAVAANADVKVTADLPEGWELDEDAVVPFSATSGLNMVMVTKAWLPDDSNDAKGAAEDAIEQIKEYFEDAEYSAVENKKMAGYDGAGFYMDISITSTFIQRQEYFYFMKGKQLFMIQGAYMADDEAGGAEVRKVMDSVKIE
jgi:hypothetical protein